MVRPRREKLVLNLGLGSAEVGFPLALAAFPAEREPGFPASILPFVNQSLARAASFRLNHWISPDRALPRSVRFVCVGGSLEISRRIFGIWCRPGVARSD